MSSPAPYAFHYQTGEVVMVGDRVRLGDDEGVVESIFLPGTEDAAAFSCFDTGGVLLSMKRFGYVMTHDSCEEEDLDFLGRGPPLS